MRYDAAPMEGLTDRVWRQAHQQFFGGADRYYAPFISPPENRVPVKKKMAELFPEANPGAPVIPQLLGKDGSCAAWMIGVLRQMGYTEINLNFGCPSGTVTAKGKGAGMLRDLDALDRFLYTVFDEAGGPISVKTRIGVERPEEFGPILEIYNRYPLPACKAPVCYNGDITTPDDLTALAAAWPNLSGLMAGRGLIADPALFRRARGGPPASKEELRAYLAQLYAGYTAAFGSPQAAISRMKAFWHACIGLFEGTEKLEKQLKKLRDPWEYEVTVNQIFTLPLRR